MTAQELQKKYKEYKRLEKITNELDDRALAYVESDDIEVREDEWDRAYSQEFEAWLDLVKATVELLGTSEAIAKKLINEPYFKKLMSAAIED